MESIFISYASEDRDEVATPLAMLLKTKGFTVWYDQFKIGAGSLIYSEIESGIAGSNFGCVILSEYFLKKDWPERELNGFFSKISLSGKTIIPVLHKINARVVLSKYPILSSFKALINSGNIEELADSIANEICIYKINSLNLSGEWDSNCGKAILSVERNYLTGKYSPDFGIEAIVQGIVKGNFLILEWKWLPEGKNRGLAILRNTADGKTMGGYWWYSNDGKYSDLNNRDLDEYFNIVSTDPNIYMPWKFERVMVPSQSKKLSWED